jgi:hypothetical protein
MKNVAKGDFQFRNTKNGIRVNTKSMTDFEAFKSYFSTHNLSYYSFFLKPQNPLKQSCINSLQIPRRRIFPKD